MKPIKQLTLLLLFTIFSQSVFSGTPDPISGAAYNPFVFSDDFSGPALSKQWKKYKSSSVIREGVLVGIEEKDGGHAAVHSITLDTFSDVELSVDLKFEGSKLTNLTFNESGFKGSHAGHICRVVVSPAKVTLRDGKTGVFENSIHAMRKAKQVDAATTELLKTKEANFPVKLEKGKWYSVTVRIQGDLMQAFIDGKLIGSLRSDGIAHAAKNKIGLVTPKQEMHYDNVKVKIP